MTLSAREVHRHAEFLLENELQRAQAALSRLPSPGRKRVERAGAQVAAALADSLLEQARREPRVAEALVSIYGDEARREVPAVPCPAD
jgi:hypothetical protein